VLAPRREAALVAQTAEHATTEPHEAKPQGNPRSIAVLPFVNMSTDAENEFFSDGLSEEILNSLARIDGMQVVGRTSSFQFKGKNEDLRAVGEKLGVATVLEGSVRREGDRARITAQLVRTSDGIHVWSQTYDRTLKDSLAVQLDIAEQVAGKSHVILGRKFVGEAIADGEVELGIQQLSELRLEPGITVVGPLPDELQHVSVVSAAVSPKARNVEAAQLFVAFLSSPVAAEAMKSSGLDLPAASR